MRTYTITVKDDYEFPFTGGNYSNIFCGQTFTGFTRIDRPDAMYYGGYTGNAFGYEVLLFLPHELSLIEEE
jgi:hypothetical protein